MVSVCTFLLQWSGCCVQHTDHTGTHVRVQMGWGYGFDMHRGRHVLDGQLRFALLYLTLPFIALLMAQLMLILLMFVQSA